MIEDGASHLFSDDWCLTDAMHRVGLQSRKQWSWSLSPPESIGHSDEARTIVRCNAVRNALQIGESFGLQTLPFDSVTSELNDAKLDPPIYSPAKEFFHRHANESTLRDEFIQPCARARSSHDLLDRSALSAIIAAGKSIITSIEGDNARLVERLIELSGADLRLNSRVSAITPGFSKKYRLSLSHSLPLDPHQTNVDEVDTIILATQFDSNDIDFYRIDVKTLTASARLDTHITHISSPVRMSSNQSVLPLNISIQNESTFTTSSTTPRPDILNVQHSRCCFKRGCLPGDDCDQCDEDKYLYRVHSMRYLEDDDIVRMIDQIPTGLSLDEHGVHFVRRRAWPRSYVQAEERRLDFVDSIEIAPDL